MSSGFDLMEFIGKRERSRSVRELNDEMLRDTVLAREDSLQGELARMRLITAERRRWKKAATVRGPR